MAFEPKYCPYPDCDHHTRASFPWRRRGFYRRKVDGRRVQRFQCLGCGRRFSTQSFRLDFRLQKPHLNRRVFEHLVAKTTLRQIARALEVKRKTVERRLLLLGQHCEEFHRHPGLWEFKANQVRILLFIDSSGDIILTNGFMKHRKTDVQRAIKRALRIRDLYQPEEGTDR